MKLNKVTEEYLVGLFSRALRDGIADMNTDGYQTDSGIVLFIEPELSRVEALVESISMFTLKFDRDNKTWGEADLGWYNPEKWKSSAWAEKAAMLHRIYEQQRQQRKIHYQKNFDPRKKTY